MDTIYFKGYEVLPNPLKHTLLDASPCSTTSVSNLRNGWSLISAYLVLEAEDEGLEVDVEER